MNKLFKNLIAVLLLTTLLLLVALYAYRKGMRTPPLAEPQGVSVVKAERGTRYYILQEDPIRGKASRTKINAVEGDEITVFVTRGEEGERLTYSRFIDVPDSKPGKGEIEGAPLEVLDAKLPEGIEGRFNFIFEDFDHPELTAFAERERMDVLKERAGGDEIRLFHLLNNWARDQFPFGTPDPYPPIHPSRLLEEIRSGRTGGFCAQYCYILEFALQALGYPAREVAVEGHVVVEAWSNSLGKWIVLDPTYRASYRREDLLLNAREIRALLHEGKEGEVAAEGSFGSLGPEGAVARFAKYSVSIKSDHLSRPIEFAEIGAYRLKLIDEQSIDDVADLGSASLFTTRPGDLYFDVNSVDIASIALSEKGEHLVFRLATFTPSFSHFEATVDDGIWRRTASTFRLLLPEARVEPLKVSFRVVNVKGIRGPESYVKLKVGSD